MFSKTVVTVLVALCARLIQSAIRARDISVVVAPTVEPGLCSKETYEPELKLVVDKKKDAY